MLSKRRASLVLGAVAILALASSLPTALAEKILLRKDIALPVNPAPGTTAAPSDPTQFSDNISLPEDPKRKGQLQAAVDNIQEKNWEVATQILQKLIELPEDVFVR